MAIIKDDGLSKEDEAVFRISNGDLQAIKNIQQNWNLKNLESALIFAVGVLRLAINTPSKKVLIEKAGFNDPVSVTPNDQLITQVEVSSQDGEQPQQTP